MIKYNFKEFLKSTKFIYICIFMLFLILSFLFPFSHDDWAWGSYIGLDRLKSYFENYNGRWMGNISVLLLTRSNALKTLTMATILTLIIFYINQIIHNNKNKTLIYLTTLLVVFMPKLILMQGVVWTSGFSNYVIPILLLLIFINSCKALFNNETGKNKRSHLIPFVILGFITTLYVEHVTIYTVVLSGFVFFYVLTKQRKICPKYLGYFLGTIFGTVLMFSNTAYRSITSGNDGYRSLGISNFINSSIKSYFETIYKNLIYNNFILNIILVVLIIFIISKALNKNNKKSLIYAGSLIIFILISFVLYSNVSTFRNVNLFLRYTDYFNGLITVFFCISILMFVILFINDAMHKKRMLFSLFSVVLIALPLFVVTPIGSRCFVPTYIFLILFVVDLMQYYMYNYKINDLVLDKILIIITLFGFAYLMLVYGYINKIYNERLEYLNKNLEYDIIVLPKLPYSSYVWQGSPGNDVFVERFKIYYNVPKNKKIEFISLKEWNKKCN